MRTKLTIEEMHRCDATAYAAAHKTPLVVVLDNVRSLNNIGSVFRTADAFLVEKIVICGISQPPPSPEIHKTALGAEDNVAWVYFDDTLEALQQLRSEGYQLWAIEQTQQSISLEKFTTQPGARYAIVLGNEVHGVQQSVVDACDGTIEIPQMGTKHSLNVSIANGIVVWKLFELLRY